MFLQLNQVHGHPIGAMGFHSDVYYAKHILYHIGAHALTYNYTCMYSIYKRCPSPHVFFLRHFAGVLYS